MSDVQLRVLIFEADEGHARHLKKILAPGCETVLESSLYQATRRFKNSPFDLSIVSLDMPDDEGEELARWLLDNFPRRQVILTGHEILPEQEELLASKSVIGFFPSPLPAQVLAGVLGQSDRGLRGQVQRMQVSDLLQALRYSQKALTLMFEDAILQQEGWVYMLNGDVIHVEVHQRNPITRNRNLLAKGFDGFDLMMKFRNGTFSEQVWQEPPERSVTVPFDGLMMNAAQKRDESLWSADESIRIRKALLIDNEAMSRMMLQQGLLAEGIDCVSLRSLDLVQSSLESQKSELLIIDSELSRDEIAATLEWLKEYDASCRVLLLGSPHWQDDLPMPCQILPRPISPKRLKEILFELTQVGFRGFLNRIGVLDFLQLCLSAIDDTKKLHIRDLSNRVDGQIYIDRGRFVHAEFGELQGEDAFYRIAAIEKGDFFEDPSFQPPAQSLAGTMPHKLMIRAGRFAKPLDEPKSVITEQPAPKPAAKPAAPPAPSPAAPLTTQDHLGGVAAKINEVSDTPAAGKLELFGEDDLQEISLNLGKAEGGVTNLFGDDEADELKLNLGGALAGGPPAAGGVTNLFGDDEADEIKLNLGGVTNLFGDDEADEIKLNLGGVLAGESSAPAASARPANGPLSAAARSSQPSGAASPRPANGPMSAAARSSQPSGAASPRPANGPMSAAARANPVAPAGESALSAKDRSSSAASKLEEMRTRFAERRAALTGGRPAAVTGAASPPQQRPETSRPAAPPRPATGPLSATARPEPAAPPAAQPTASVVPTGADDASASGGMTNLFSDDELDEINFSLGSGVP